MVVVEPVELDDVPWEHLDALAGRSVLCTRPWLDHLCRAQGAHPVVARLRRRGTTVGWYTGAVARRGGLRLLGSPLPGWGMSYMGFDWDEPVDAAVRREALSSVRRWAFTTLRCVHLEVLERRDVTETALPWGFRHDVFHSYERTLVDDATMLAAMSSNARRNLRRSVDRELVVEEIAASGAEEFVGTYYRNALRAFARRGTRPSYGEDRVRTLVDAVGPSGRLLLVRARTADGRTAATNITTGLPGGAAVFLMGSSDRDLLDARPNEAVMWHAMRAWRDRGASTFDFGGGGTYKEKFGARSTASPWVRSTLLPGGDRARSLVRHLEARRRRVGPIASSTAKGLEISSTA